MITSNAKDWDNQSEGKYDGNKSKVTYFIPNTKVREGGKKEHTGVLHFDEFRDLPFNWKMDRAGGLKNGECKWLFLKDILRK